MVFNILYGGGTPRDKFLEIVAALCAALLAIMIHEVAHGYVAKLNGDNTAQMMGRLTLNPVKHFDLMGFLMFAFVGFGWAKPVPINPNNFKNYKKGLVTTSLAGVFANFLMSAVSFGLLLATEKIILSVGISNEVAEVFAILFLNFFVYGTIINLSLIAFNILPVYPLDGFNVLATVTKPGNKLVMFLRRYGYYILIGLLLLGSVFPQINFIGMYFSAFENAILKLFNIIFGA